MKNLLVFVSGSGTNFQAIIDGIAKKEITNARICGVVSSSRDVYALDRAKNHNVPAVVVSKKDYPDPEDFDNANLNIAKEFGADVIVLAGYLCILGKKFVDCFENRIINIHPSLIPSFCGKGYYGLKVHEAVLEYGAKITGATTHLVDLGTDTGAVILQKSVEVLDSDTPQTLQKRVLEAEHIILKQTLNLFCNDGIYIKGRKVTILGEKEN